MFTTLLLKELRLLLLSPKYIATFTVCVVLLLLSVFVGIQDYQATADQVAEARRMDEQLLLEATSWMGLQTRAYREADPLQVFVAGTHHDIGRYTPIGRREIDLDQSPYMEDTLFALFRFLDFAFIVQVVLALFAILFTYDAISGERERGTLRLTFANAVPRVMYLLSKLAGAWLGLVVPLLIPLALAVLLVLVFQVPFGGADWTRLGLLLAYALLYFTGFIALGITVSALTRQASTSFVILLMVWVVFVLILPRVGATLAAQSVAVPTVAEVESQKEAFASATRSRFIDDMRTTLATRNAAMESMTPDERDAYLEANEWEWMQEQDRQRKEMDAEIDAHSRRLNEEVRVRQAVQERRALAYARLSPAAAFGLAAMTLAGTDVGQKARYEEQMDAYRTDFMRFVEEKSGNSGGGIQIRLGGAGSGGSIGGGDDESLDLTELPRFEAAELSLASYINPALVDVALLAVYAFLSVASGFVAFLRYDVR